MRGILDLFFLILLDQVSPPLKQSGPITQAWFPGAHCSSKKDMVASEQRITHKWLKNRKAERPKLGHKSIGKGLAYSWLLKTVKKDLIKLPTVESLKNNFG